MNKKDEIFKNKYANITVKIFTNILSLLFAYFLFVKILFPMGMATLGSSEIGQAKSYTIQNTQINVVQNSTIGSFMYENFVINRLEDYIFDITDEVYLYPGNIYEFGKANGLISQELEELKGAVGCSCSRENKNIIIIDSSDYSKNVIYHEVGHHIDRLWQNASETEDFQQILAEEAEALWPTPKIDDYAKSTPAESFAEGYAVYYINPSRMKKKAPRMYAYFDYIVQTERKIHAEKVAEQGA